MATCLRTLYGIWRPSYDENHPSTAFIILVHWYSPTVLLVAAVATVATIALFVSHWQQRRLGSA